MGTVKGGFRTSRGFANLRSDELSKRQIALDALDQKYGTEVVDQFLSAVLEMKVKPEFGEADRTMDELLNNSARFEDYASPNVEMVKLQHEQQQRQQQEFFRNASEVARIKTMAANDRFEDYVA